MTALDTQKPRVMLPNDVARCAGVGSDEEGWREGKKVIGCAEWQRIGNRIQVGIGGGVWTIDAADLVHNAKNQGLPKAVPLD